MAAPDDKDPADPTRRRFLATASTVAMAGGLAAGYGTCAGMAARFLYPAGGRPMDWTFVTELARMKPGHSLSYRAPDGSTVVVTRQGDAGTAADFLALSSICPHLGCQVHWEDQEKRFFCPCHNGTFDPTGKATGGPPAQAGQSLPRYAVKVEGGLLFIQVPQGTIAGES